MSVSAYTPWMQGGYSYGYYQPTPADMIAQLQAQLYQIQLQLDALLAPPPPQWTWPTWPTAPAPAIPQGPKHGKTDFVISSFNVLGDSHTKASGNKPGMASGKARMQGVVQLLAQHKVDIVGFQEFQHPQHDEFRRLAGSKYGVFPATSKGKDTENAIAWNKQKFDLVKAETIAIPYFEGKIRRMPIVRLRDKQTGQELYVTNFHNPADTRDHHNQGKHRAEAARREIAMVNRLRAQTGLPVFVTGDMNEKASYAQKITQGADMHTAAGAMKKPGIDWIFGTDEVKFGGWVRDDSNLVDRTSDHPMVVARATIGG